MPIDAVSFALASPARIREMSFGEVQRPDTIDYKDGRSVRGGLFCERIFGAVRPHMCRCGKLKSARYLGIICPKCGVEVQRRVDRGERFGHVNLVEPVAHVWFWKGTSSPIGLLLRLTPDRLERVLMHVDRVVIEPGQSGLRRGAVCEKEEEAFGRLTGLTVGTGAGAVRQLLARLDLGRMGERLERRLPMLRGSAAERCRERLLLVQALIASRVRPEWMVLRALPVLPPALRPIVRLPNGRYAVSELNDLYAYVIRQNHRLARLRRLGAPDVVLTAQARELQRAVDCLLDNGRRTSPLLHIPAHSRIFPPDIARGPSRPRTAADLVKRHIRSACPDGLSPRPAHSLTDRMRRSLASVWDRSVSHSFRGVAVSAPEMPAGCCGIPLDAAVILYEPFVVARLVDRYVTIGEVRQRIRQRDPAVLKLLERVMDEVPLLLALPGRWSPLSVQAMRGGLVSGSLIQLPPSALLGRSEGVVEAVLHLPAGRAAGEELDVRLPDSELAADASLLALAKDEAMTSGLLVATSVAGEARGTGRLFGEAEEALLAWACGQIDPRAEIRVRWLGRVRETTAARLWLHGELSRAGLRMPLINEPLDSAALARWLRYLRRHLSPPQVHAFTRSAADAVARFGDSMPLPAAPTPPPGPLSWVDDARASFVRDARVRACLATADGLPGRLVAALRDVVLADPNPCEERSVLGCRVDPICSACWRSEHGGSPEPGTPVGLRTALLMGQPLQGWLEALMHADGPRREEALARVREAEDLLEARHARGGSELHRALSERGAEGCRELLLERLRGLFGEDLPGLGLLPRLMVSPDGRLWGLSRLGRCKDSLLDSLFIGDPVQVLTEAALAGRRDDLQTGAARALVGRPAGRA